MLMRIEGGDDQKSWDHRLIVQRHKADPRKSRFRHGIASLFRFPIGELEATSRTTGRDPKLETEKFAGQAMSAWEILESRFASQVSTAELDHLFARFVLGLTSPFYDGDEPAIHLSICQTILALKLSPDRVDQALHSVPKPTEAWVESAFRSVESLGEKEGRKLLEQQLPAQVDGRSSETRTPTSGRPTAIGGRPRE